MKTVPFLPVLLLMAFPFVSHAQTLVIEKDMFDATHDAKYYLQKSDGSLKPLTRKPIITKNSKVIFRIVNLNPFCYSVSYKFTQQDIQQQYDSTATLTKFLMGDISGFADPMKVLEAKDTGAFTGNRAPGEDEMELFRNLATAGEAEMSAAEKTEQEQLIVFDAAAQELYNKNEPKDKIIDNMSKIIRAGFALTPSEPLLTDKKILDNTIKFKNGYKKYKSALYRQLSRLDSADNPSAYADLKENLQQADERNKQFTATATISQLLMIDNLPAAVKNAPFTYTNQETISHDFADLEVDIVNRRRTIAGANVPDLDSGLVIPFREHITARGEFIIRSSIGFSFPTYFNQAKRYDVENGKVAEFRDDNFVPNFSTFVNFYPFKGKFNNFGGVLGIGYPLTGKNKDMSVLLGVSEALGDKNFVIFNLGLAAGQTNRLAGDWYIGKTMDDTTAEIPTEKTWKIGLFVGITISLFNR